MRMVIDSNQLRADSLQDYLTQSRSNFAVLPDYIPIEIYKSGSLEGIYQSMSILSAFPDQVVVLKSTNLVCGLNGRSSGLQQRLIDHGQTRGFKEFIRDLRLAKAGNQHAQNQLRQMSVVAAHQMDRIYRDMDSLATGINLIATEHSMDERRQVREGIGFTQELIDKTVKNVMTIAALHFSNHPKVWRLPTYRELFNTFIFRNSLCTYLLALDWGANGGVQGVSPKRLQNDLIDMSFAAYATFFDGLLSNDKKCIQIHQRARFWLTKVLHAK